MTNPTSAEKTLGVLLFPGFELLDVCGPLEMFGNLKGAVRPVTVAEKAGPVESTQALKLTADHALADCPPLDMLLVPGGWGTREEVGNRTLLDWLVARAARAEVVMSVCTGSALLARAGILDGRRATSNKHNFQWVTEQGPKVEWVKEARWVDDGKFVTSSGVSAGIDMALAVISRIHGDTVSTTLADATEYEWHRDPSWDPYAKRWGLVS
jgi:transcriptional regulator GlxA family with amidase domain